MNTNDEQFKGFLGSLPHLLQDSIKNVVDSLTLDTGAIDEDFLKILYKTNLEVYKTIKKGLLESENQPNDEIKIKFLNVEFDDFELLNSQEEDIVIWEGNYITNANIFIDSAKTIIINGNLKCMNLIVDDSNLFINGNLDCNILFGASGNDKLTQIAQDINAKAIIENGHYTHAGGCVYSEEIIMLHNEINSDKEIKTNKIYESNEKDKYKLIDEITGKEGYFDEEKFMELIASNQNFSLLE